MLSPDECPLLSCGIFHEGPNLRSGTGSLAVGVNATRTGVSEMLLLDTDLCLALLRGDRGVLEHLPDGMEPVAICFASVGELYAAAYTSSLAVNNTRLVHEFLLTVPVLESNNDIAARFGRLKSEDTTDKSDTILYIAAAALSSNATLLSGRPEEYAGIDELQLQVFR